MRSVREEGVHGGCQLPCSDSLWLSRWMMNRMMPARRTAGEEERRLRMRASASDETCGASSRALCAERQNTPPSNSITTRELFPRREDRRRPTHPPAPRALILLVDIVQQPLRRLRRLRGEDDASDSKDRIIRSRTSHRPELRPSKYPHARRPIQCRSQLFCEMLQTTPTNASS